MLAEMPVTAPLKLYRGDSDDVRNLRLGTRLERYRLQSRLGEGGFATVFAALDTIENRRVAIKIPDARYAANAQSLEDIRHEVRIMLKLKHPNILPLLDARLIDGHFVMVFPLGTESLADRLTRRLSRGVAVDLILQMVKGVAHAHTHSILHRDIKPENFILFPGHELRLTDFGLARVERGGHHESASGTLGFIAPEQAMGKPSYRSDVFSLGLVMYRMLAGALPEYPFASPLPGFNRLRRGLSRDFVAFIRKAIDPNPTRRFRDAVAMHNALRRIRCLANERTGGERREGARSKRTTRRVA